MGQGCCQRSRAVASTPWSVRGWLGVCQPRRGGAGDDDAPPGRPMLAPVSPWSTVRRASAGRGRSCARAATAGSRPLAGRSRSSWRGRRARRTGTSGSAGWAAARDRPGPATGCVAATPRTGAPVWTCRWRRGWSCRRCGRWSPSATAGWPPVSGRPTGGGACAAPTTSAGPSIASRARTRTSMCGRRSTARPVSTTSWFSRACRRGFSANCSSCCSSAPTRGCAPS